VKEINAPKKQSHSVFNIEIDYPHAVHCSGVSSKFHSVMEPSISKEDSKEWFESQSQRFVTWLLIDDGKVISYYLLISH
jgi:hypothetical protein